jgi:hypothetical protein
MLRISAFPRRRAGNPRHAYKEAPTMPATELPARSAVESCRHEPLCPSAAAIDHGAARVIVTYPEQGWSLLCNGVITFDDTGELLPDGHPVGPQRGPAEHMTPAFVREVACA